jgi:hypothetical protein
VWNKEKRKIKSKILTNEELKQRNNRGIDYESSIGRHFILERRYKTGKTKRFVVKNLKQWCRENKMNYNSLYRSFYDDCYCFNYKIILRNVHIVDGVVK